MLVRALHLDGGSHRVAGAWKRIEERVALRVDLLAVVHPERLAHDAPMRRQHRRVLLVAELLQEAGAALDVAENEGDGPRRKIRHVVERIRRADMIRAHA